jgi:hypothetical protein
MGGYELYLLVKAGSRKEAIDSAAATIDEWWEDGSLQEGDHGYVDAKEDGTGEVVSLKKAGEKRLRELNRRRVTAMRGYLAEALAEAAKNGYFSLSDVPPEETKSTLVGFYLKKAGEVMNGNWCPWGVVYDTGSYECGFTDDRIKELMENPGSWWLVQCTVGP